MPDVVFDFVMGDVMTTIVIELMAVPPQVRLNHILSLSLYVCVCVCVVCVRVASVC